MTDSRKPGRFAPRRPTRRSPARPTSSRRAPRKAVAPLTADALARAVVDKLHVVQAVGPATATPNDWYMAFAYAVRDQLLGRWRDTVLAFAQPDIKVVCCFSAEFLVGPHLGNALVNLGLEDAARGAASALGLDLDTVLAQEEEPGLGNGGLGRLAACYLDSLAMLQVPAVGYGIRYEFGIFDQVIRDGWQVEVTDKWLRLGNPWEIARPKVLYPNDEPAPGKRLRLEQQYFFVSCSLQDIIALHTQMGGSLDTLPQGFAVQLNDTHPSIAVAELMRLLVDEHLMDWDDAWAITTRSLAYTARSGVFSSDRSIKEYCETIWQASPLLTP